MCDREREPIRELTRLIEARVGHLVPERNVPFLEEAVHRRVVQLGLPDLSAYVENLAQQPSSSEWHELFRLVLVHESYLFRGVHQLEVLLDELLPEILAAREGDRSLCIWSAGCARGEEAVSLAVLLADRRELEGWDWKILATDVDRQVLEEARRGIYEGRTVREVPEAILSRFFERLGGERYRVRGEILERIDYRELNLVHEPLEPAGAPFDVILIRNVLIYFRPESQRRVVEAMAGLLAPHGYIVPGPSESLWQIVDTLEPVERQRTYFYRIRQHVPNPPSPRGKWSDLSSRAEAARPGGHGQGGGRLRRGRPLPEARAGGEHPAVRRGEQYRAIREKELARKESPRLPERVPGNPEPSAGPEAVIEAIAAGRLDEAHNRLAVMAEEGGAAAVRHALEGLLAEIAGRPSAVALAAYRKVLFLEPGWLQFRLLLADLLWKEGDVRRAVVEYRRIVRDAGQMESFPYAERLGLPDTAEAVERARTRLRRSSS